MKRNPAATSSAVPYPGKFVPTAAPTPPDLLREHATLGILWQQDVSATVFTRERGRVALGQSAPRRHSRRLRSRGTSGRAPPTRRVGLEELIALAAAPPGDAGGRRLGQGHVRPVWSLAAESVEGGPSSTRSCSTGGRSVLRLLGSHDRRFTAGDARRDRRGPRRLRRCVRRRRPTPLVHDLYACAVDQIARDPPPRRRGSGSATASCAAGRARRSCSSTGSPRRSPSCRLVHAGLAALERRLTSWVDSGLERRSSAPWLLALRLDEDNDGQGDAGALTSVVLELWLQAADDPTLALPASLLEDGGDDVFGFLRSG